MKALVERLKILLLCRTLNPKLPLVGESWRLRKPDGDPFPRENESCITILDVQDSWVRFKIGEVYNDERLPISTFLFIYEPSDRATNSPRVGEKWKPLFETNLPSSPPPLATIEEVNKDTITVSVCDGDYRFALPLNTFTQKFERYKS